MPFTGAFLKSGLLTLLLNLTTTHSKANIETIIQLINEPEANNLESARKFAAQQAVGNGDELGYHSTADEDYQTFSGTFTPPELPENLKGQYIFKLAIFSDDGCNVTVDDKLVHKRHGKSQALPNLSASFYPLDVTLTPGKSVNLKVDYSNVYYIPAPNAPDIDGCTLFVYLERVPPFHIVELAPRVKDEAGNDIPGSEKPNIGLPLTPFVEEDPHTNRIAHREIKLKFDDAYSGKKITWSLTERPDAAPAAIRGEWSDSQTHENRFEKSTTYGENGFKIISQKQGSTLVAKDGHTAIRINIPPIGFNQARIKIQIEGIDIPFDLIDMEVPAVVVIDPGHGGKVDLDGSDANHATGKPSGVEEREMTLDYGIVLFNSLKNTRNHEKLNLRLFMTRDSDKNLSGKDRAFKARDNGADVFISIHFNATNGVARGVETWIRRPSDNNNTTQDRALANRVVNGIFKAIENIDNKTKNRGVKPGLPPSVDELKIAQLAVLSDSHYGQLSGDYHPIRGTLAEIEFIDVPAVDILLNTEPTASPVKAAVTNSMRDSILEDLRIQP